ncbi:hypothetical protein ABPG75_001229 [Micractinium tetrahymenae]
MAPFSASMPASLLSALPVPAGTRACRAHADLLGFAPVPCVLCPLRDRTFPTLSAPPLASSADSKGRTVDKNTLIILTSNVGSSVIEKGGGGIGFQLDNSEEDSSYNRIKSLVNEELKQYFRPEFLNRLDEIIVFRQLTKSEVKQIADIMLKQVFTRAEEKGIKIDVTERFKDRLVDEGYNPAYGARPLRRAIMRLLEDSMAERMLAGEIKEGDSVIIDVDADGQISVLNGDKKMTSAIPTATGIDYSG